MIEAALKARRDGDQVKSDMEPATVPITLVPAATALLTSEQPFKRALTLDPSLALTGEKENTTVGSVNFNWGHTNSHKDVGFTLYFEQNLLELKGPLPLTIFNKAWQDAALQYHAEKRPKNNDNLTERGMRYTGYPYPSEWLMSYSDWSLNYSEFLITMRDICHYETLGQWIVLHKMNADKILRKDGFMVALRYDIWIWANAFAHHVVKNGVSSFSDISVFRQEVYDTAYGESRRLDKLSFRDSNPYAIGGPRFGCNPHTGLNPNKRGGNPPTAPRSAPQAGATALVNPNPGPGTNNLPAKPKESRPKSSGYLGKNFNPAFAEL
ncbi:hypothetical protein PTTG_04418 [Puccinia triticina 1-1 BBBD Race 1]|uniref:Uncharacterized protein n=1 Tax=Puccinia triticina (isolate 1-1 / race 1 (BBBD)) TaxID=630390 RepID=A0A180GR46_PUCT1|nr:hypothetical protein PTTG_04418 [Puccinia triticina 1-1 BBBD Race 1]